MRLKTVFAAAAAILCSPASLPAQEVTLRAVTAFAEGSQFSKSFESMIEKINKENKGVLQINFIGGPRAIPTFEVGNAVRSRVVDLANLAGSFYTNLMPEADGFKMLGKPMPEQRANGTWAYLNELHNKKINSYYLARPFTSVRYHLYFNRKIEKPDFSGLKIRVSPAYRDIVQALGGTPINTPPGEVYTALERGVVDGYGWPSIGIFDLGWDKVTKYRMEPSFYTTELAILVNLDTWKSLNDAQRKILTDAGLWTETLDAEIVSEIKSEYDKQAKVGIQPIVLSPADAEAFVKKANEVAWESIIAKAPVEGKKLRELAGN